MKNTSFPEKGIFPNSEQALDFKISDGISLPS